MNTHSPRPDSEVVELVRLLESVTGRELDFAGEAGRFAQAPVASLELDSLETLQALMTMEMLRPGAVIEPLGVMSEVQLGEVIDAVFGVGVPARFPDLGPRYR